VSEHRFACDVRSAVAVAVAVNALEDLTMPLVLCPSTITRANGLYSGTVREIRVSDYLAAFTLTRRVAGRHSGDVIPGGRERVTDDLLYAPPPTLCGKS
jgi:hypothetical protein